MAGSALRERQPTLLILSAVPMARIEGGYRLDRKLAEGLSKIAELWPGGVICALRLGRCDQIPFGADYRADALAFRLVDRDEAFEAVVAQADLILAAADDHRDFGFSAAGRPPVAYVIENTAASRARLVWLEAQGLIAKFRSVAWMAATEVRRRRALRRACAVQVNGRPAFDAYRPLLRKPHMFFDTRIKATQLPDADMIAARIATARAGRPLRLAFTGRLERIKGADHLLAVARRLRAIGIPFTLDIYGSGSLSAAIAGEIARSGLQDAVRLCGPVDFDTALVPALRRDVDLFVCCHRQSDPSCTYLETLALGVPIVGYGNAAFRGVLELGNVGIATPMDRPDLLADAIATLHRDRDRLVTLALNAVGLGREHHFEAVMGARVDHLKALLPALP